MPFIDGHAPFSPFVGGDASFQPFDDGGRYRLVTVTLRFNRLMTAADTVW